MKKTNVVKDKRKKLLEGLSADELAFMESKLKKEHSSLVEDAEEDEAGLDEKRMLSEDDDYELRLKDKKIEEGLQEGFITGEKAEDVYDPEEAEELVDNDEITAAEEGFVRGAEEAEEKGFSKKKKKKR